MRDAIHEGHLLARCTRDIHALLGSDGDHDKKSGAGWQNARNAAATCSNGSPAGVVLRWLRLNQ